MLRFFFGNESLCKSYNPLEFDFDLWYNIMNM